MNPIITLTHFERGPMRVSVHDEATFWASGRRQWVCDDAPELGYFDDADFDESPDEIDLALQMKAAHDAADRLLAENKRLRAVLQLARGNIVHYAGNPVIAEIDAALEGRP